MIVDSRSSSSSSSTAAGEDRSRKRRELKRSASGVYRRAILDAAERVFARGAFADARIADIARDAGMASGTVYNYFRSKEEIFQSLGDALGDELHARLDSAHASTSDPLARLEALVRTVLAHVEEHRSILPLLYQSEKRCERYLRAFERALRDAIAGDALRRDFQAADLALFLTGAMSGTIRAWLAAGGRKGLTARAPALVDLFVRGAAR